MKSFHDIVDTKILPHVKELCRRIYWEGDTMTLDGITCFPEGQDFLHGTVISGFVQVMESLPKNTQEYKEWLAMTQTMIQKNSGKFMNTFGILEFLLSIYELKSMGVYQQIVDEDLEVVLKKNLHWNVFIDEKTMRFKRPRANNYYGVAYRIALLREFFEWDTQKNSSVLLDRLFEHVHTGPDGSIFMDESDDEGRYDKYSFTIASELCELHGLTGSPLPDKLKQMLKQSMATHMLLAGNQGVGFTYGRSVGANATGAILEIMPLAMQYGLHDDLAFLHGIIMEAGKRMSEFWFSPKRSMFNLWDDGRRTDGYRGKHRILEVNLDMSLKMIRANKCLKALGWHKVKPCEEQVYQKKCVALPPYRMIRFQQNEYDRCLFIIRMAGRVVMLPVINGSRNWYDHVAYLPIPSSIDLMMGPANARGMYMVPMIQMVDGKRIAPIVYSKHVKVKETSCGVVLTYMQDELCVIDGHVPTKHLGIRDRITYTFTNDYIERVDQLHVDNPDRYVAIHMELSVFDTCQWTNSHMVSDVVVFEDGNLSSITFEGIAVTAVEDVADDDDYHTPCKPLQTRIVCHKKLDDKSIRICTRINF